MTQKNFNLKKLTKPILVLTTLAFILGLNRSEKKIIDIDDPGLVYQTGKLIYEGEMFTGVVTAYYEETSSTVRSRVRYLNGRRHGLSKTWYRNGELETIRRYEHGKKSGVHYGWWPNRERKFEYPFRNSRYHGLVREWHKNGQLFIRKNYNHGLESGHQESWMINSDLRYKYQAIDGKQYGYIGTKTCIRPQ